jgi:ABC-type molybdenum transport system ATPase subunit/photorepair protein PhrA
MHDLTAGRPLVHTDVMARAMAGTVVGDSHVSSSTGAVAVRAERLVRRFGETRAVDGLSFEIRAGETFGLLGHNGAGKTTTIRLLNGVLGRDGGDVDVLGLDPALDGVRVRARTGALTETPSLDERLSARENLRFYGLRSGSFRTGGDISRDHRRQHDEGVTGDHARQPPRTRPRSHSGSARWALPGCRRCCC